MAVVRTTSQVSPVGVHSDAGLLEIVAGFALLANLVGLLVFPVLVLMIGAYLAIVLGGGSWASAKDTDINTDRTEGLLMLASTLALAAGPAVGFFHALSYELAAWICIGAAALAVAVGLASQALQWIRGLLLMSALAAMAVVVVVAPPPPGAEDPDNPSVRTPVRVNFVDEFGDPVEGVQVWFDMRWVFLSAPDRRPEPDATTYTRSDGSQPPGAAAYTVNGDPRWKMLVVRASREPVEGEYGSGNGPTDAGYDDVELELPILVPGVPVETTVVVREKPHPEVAFLTVVLECGDRKVRNRPCTLWLRTDPALPDPDQPYGHGLVATAFDSYRHRAVFRLETDWQDRRLWLFGRAYQTWSPEAGTSPMPPLVRLAEVEPLAVGERRRIAPSAPPIPLVGQRIEGGFGD